MQRVRVTITGVSPLLMNPATEALIEQLRTRTPAQRRRDWTAEEEAGEKLYKNAKGLIGIPIENLLASLVEAGRSVTLTGRSKVSTATSTQLYAFLSAEEDFLPFPADYQHWQVDKRRGRNPNGGEMVALTRPRFDNWSVTVTLVIDESLIDLSKIRELFDIAGRSVGLCDFRPGCRGRFGRSAVTAWDVLTPKAPATTSRASTNGKIRQLAGARR